MKITGIKQQVKRADYYSVFVDGKYAFSLSEMGLLQSKIVSGQEISAKEQAELKKFAIDDKLYAKALRYVAMRPRSVWEVEFYLKRNQASPALTTTILNKLSDIGLLDDEKLAQAVVHDRLLLRPASRRKIIQDLKQKRVPKEVIDKVIASEVQSDTSALIVVIKQKRRQTKYQDDLKLMQYLARQGFDYNDIKSALKNNSPEDY